MQVEMAQKGAQFHRNYLSARIAGLLSEIELYRDELENVILLEGHVQTLESADELPADDAYILMLHRNTCENCLRIIMPFEKTVRDGPHGVQRNHKKGVKD